MSNIAAPFGFRPIYHPTGLDRGILRYIAAAYASVLYKGMPVSLNTNGTIQQAAGGADILGIFVGCEFIDANGKPNYQNFWPAGQTVQAGTQPRAYVWEDPATVFEVQAAGPIPLTAIGDQADASNITAGNAMTGLSQATLGSLVGVGVQGQFTILDISHFEDNSPGDLFTIVQVKIARHQLVANKVAI
jgi:hypothetical protein